MFSVVKKHERTVYENLGKKRRETKKRHSLCTRLMSEQEEKGKKLCERHEATGQPLLLKVWLAQHEGSKMPARVLHRYALFRSTSLVSQFTNCCNRQVINACFTAQGKHVGAQKTSISMLCSGVKCPIYLQKISPGEYKYFLDKQRISG